MTTFSLGFSNHKTHKTSFSDRNHSNEPIAGKGKDVHQETDLMTDDIRDHIKYKGQIYIFTINEPLNDIKMTWCCAIILVP